MKKPLTFLRYFLFFFAFIFLAGCSESQPDDVYKLLEEKAKVKTFPLTIVLTEPLSGSEFPEDLKVLCKYSGVVCKTLPTAGILRLGPDQYFTYNAIASLNVTGEEGDDEATIAQSVQNQVSAYYFKTKLQSFDSLRAANKPDLNFRALTAQYVLNNKDSIYFYSARASDPSVVVAGNRSFTVYKDAAELRRVIDEQICKNSFSVSVFYAPLGITAGSVPTGMFAGDTCVGGSKFEKLNDGKGNLFVGKLIEKNSKSCGFAYPTGIAGDTCISFSRYQKLHDGRGGFKTGDLLEKNSPSCGYTAPKPQVESRSPTTRAVIPGTQAVRVNASVSPQATANTTESAGAASADRRCAKTGDPMCEQDERGNYTGRRIQYCYNSAGKVVRTIVLKKCDGDCRCLGD